MQCACYIADGDGPFRLNPCPEHERWAKAVRQNEQERCAVEARRIAAFYPQGSDGRNTFVLLAEWIEARGSAT